MSKGMVTPIEVAKLRGSNRGWYDQLNEKDKAWTSELIKELAKQQKPAYGVVARYVVELFNISVTSENVARILKKKVNQLCRQKGSL